MHVDAEKLIGANKNFGHQQSKEAALAERRLRGFEKITASLMSAVSRVAHNR
jgi:hypothetical protein